MGRMLPSNLEGEHCNSCSLEDITSVPENKDGISLLAQIVDAKVNLNLAHPVLKSRVERMIAHLPIVDAAVEQATDKCADTITKNECPFLRTERNETGLIDIIPRNVLRLNMD